MRSRTRSTVAALLAGLICVAGLAAPDVGAAEPDPVSNEQAPPAPVAPDQPSTRDTEIAFGGGLLVLALVGVGLTITIRSLLQDMRSRRQRYRRRTRREPRST